MKKIVSFLLVVVLVCSMLPVHDVSAANYYPVMSSSEFVSYLKTILSRNTGYWSQWPYNVGYYDGNKIYFDCNNLGKSIIWSSGSIANNYTKGHHSPVNNNGGLGDWSPAQLKQYGNITNTDFSTLVPGEWLYMAGHIGYYIGDGQVIECTTDFGANCVTQSQIDSSGRRNQNGGPYWRSWESHGKVPWIRYCSYNHGTGDGSWKDAGVCKECGSIFDWASTFDASCASYATVTKTDGFYPRRDVPYDVGERASIKLKKGTEVEIVGSVTNAYGNKWYQISYNNNTEKLYAYSNWLTPTRPLESSISINVTWPYEGQTIPKQSHNLIGTVSSSTNNLKKITGYLDGRQVSSVSVNTKSFSLAKSDIDYKMPFNALSSGTHTIKIVATDTAGGSQSLTRVFHTEYSPCEATSVTTEDTANGKFVIMTCSGANISYTASNGKSGSGTGSVRAFVDSTTTFTVTTSKSGRTNNVVTKTVYVDQVQAPQFSTKEWYGGTKVTITSTPGAQIYYRFDGTQEGEYHEPFNETRNITVYAHAVKWGMKDSETTSFTIKASKPDTPVVQLVDTASKIAVGKTAVFRWNSDTRAKEYAISLYKDGALLKTATQESNVFSYVLDTAGKYEVSVKAMCPLGNSGDSAKVAVTAMSPSTVQFLDDDGSVLAKYTVAYGDYVSRQNTPAHKGHYFSGWYPANNYYEVPVTQNVTYTATYTPIEYDVTFYDVDGLKYGDTQKVPYQQSATAPDYTPKVPAGYVFSGWTVIEASDTDSACDYSCVDANLKLQAVIRWTNDELPIYVSIASAKVAPEGNDSVYTVTANLTNWPSSASNIYLIAVLKTEARNNDVVKTVFADRVQVNLSAGQTLSQTIKLHYNGIAKNVEVYALERKADGTTGSAYSLAASAKVVFSTTWTNWSDWSTTRPENKASRTIETKTQYRYQDKETTTSSNSSLSGWTLYNSSWAWSDWGAWSSWSTNYVAADDATQVESRTAYHYYYFVCSSCGAHMHGYGRCYTWAGGCGSSAVYESSYHALKAPVPYSSALDFHGTGVYYTDNTGEGRGFAYINPSSQYYIAPVTQYRYRARTKIWTYYYYRWSAWSSWTDTPVSASSTRNVETRTLYRYRDEVQIYDTGAGTEDTSGQNYRFTGTICSGQDLSGKVATIMVYQSKNMDPNQYQMQYVGQTTIGTGNTYEANFIPINQPTIESGNYIVALGVQGTTGLLSVDVLEAPKPEYAVRFLMDDGGVISTQTVPEGGNATVPTIPTKTGYRFVGWSDRSTGIYKNVDIYAQFEKEQYIVAFVDWVNESIGFQKYYYGDTITAPYTPVADGRTFKGWDAILDGNTTVTDNMVVSAVYDVQTFTVRFLNADGSVYQTQQVPYGEAAELPDALTVEGKVFLGWSTDVTWWDVTTNMDVNPIVVFEQTTVAPIANIDSFEVGMATDVELTSEEGATIYYTTDGTAPTKRSSVYSAPIHLEDTTIVSAMAVSDGKNDSEVINVFFVHDDTPVEQEIGEVLPLDSKRVDAVANLEVPIEVELNNNPGLIGYSLILECDRSVFYIDVEDGDRICTPGPVSKYGTFTVTPYWDTGWEITWLSSYPSIGDGTMFTLPLRVGEEIEEGNYEIKLGYAAGRVYTEDSEEIALYRSMVHFVGSDLSHDHSYVEKITPPTCTEQGYTTHSCSVCGDSYVDAYIPALGHDYQNGVCSRCGAKDPAAQNPFVDVAEGQYYYAPVLWAYYHTPRVTGGTDKTHFSPNQNCTREQIVTFIWKAYGGTAPKMVYNPFQDVKSDQYYYNAVLWAVENGITSGVGGGKFGVSQPCTREQVVTFLWTAAGKPEPTAASNPFRDVKAGQYYYKPVLWAVENGITKGMTADTFGVGKTCTRAQVVTFLYKAVGQGE